VLARRGLELPSRRVDFWHFRPSTATGCSRDALDLAIVKLSLNRYQTQLEITSVLGQGSGFAARFPVSRVAGF